MAEMLVNSVGTSQHVLHIYKDLQAQAFYIELQALKYKNVTVKQYQINIQLERKTAMYIEIKRNLLVYQTQLSSAKRTGRKILPNCPNKQLHSSYPN